MSSVNAQLKTINCTECSAPLDLHGGRKVKSISCPYCGAVLNNKEEYKVLEHFLLANRPYSPLQIGQEGVLNAVKFTVIGFIEYKSSGSRWLEYQLFSPTHGYAWMSYDAGHFVFGHKVRYYPATYSAAWKSELKVNNKNYKVIDDYTAYISFVEGELTWIARRDDSVKGLDAVAPPYIYSIEKTENEEEYSLGEYVLADTIYKAFSVEGKPAKTSRVHPAQPFTQGSFLKPMCGTSKYFSILYLFLFIVLMFFEEPDSLFKEQIPAIHYQDSFISKPFTIDSPDTQLKLLMVSSVDNNWTFFTVKLLKENKVVHSVSKEIYYYHKGSESEGSQKASLIFNAPEEGHYTLSIHGRGGTNLQPLFIELKKGFLDNSYFGKLLAFTIIFAWIVPFFSRLRFEKKRWSDNE